MVPEKPVVNLTESKNGVLIPIRVTPRGHKNSIVGVRDGVLLISVSAPPVKNAANEAVIEVLHDALRCPKNALTLGRGNKSRDKVIVVSGLEIEDVRARLA